MQQFCCRSEQKRRHRSCEHGGYIREQNETRPMRTGKRRDGKTDQSEAVASELKESPAPHDMILQTEAVALVEHGCKESVLSVIRNRLISLLVFKRGWCKHILEYRF